jgi:hypothetical protein
MNGKSLSDHQTAWQPGPDSEAPIIMMMVARARRAQAPQDLKLAGGGPAGRARR